MSALLAAAGISAANLVVPAFEGPPVAMAPEAVAAEWLEQLHYVSRKVCASSGHGRAPLAVFAAQHATHLLELDWILVSGAAEVSVRVPVMPSTMH